METIYKWRKNYKGTTGNIVTCGGEIYKERTYTRRGHPRSGHASGGGVHIRGHIHKAIHTDEYMRGGRYVCMYCTSNLHSGNIYTEGNLHKGTDARRYLDVEEQTHGETYTDLPSVHALNKLCVTRDIIRGYWVYWGYLIVLSMF